jgi:DNA-binding GntR family transcriptional regulator
MRKSESRIPVDILKEIFPQELSRFQFPDKVYAQLKKMIRSGKLKTGQRLWYDRVLHDFNISRWAAHRMISKLKKDWFLISKSKAGSFVV